ncbi:MAG: hypothetical protein K8I27_14030 [Planctomycetes bacterium]|nr:hypothetical protein [Planctomycetota bacterium]
MIRKLIPCLLLIAVAFAGFVPAQEAEPKPVFENAPITEVLVWAQKSIGCGFIYEGEVLNDPATGKVRRVTATHTEPASNPEKTLLLFELLRRASLVAFEVGGLPGPTYQLYSAAGAARNSVILQEPAELEGLYFASLSIRLRHAPVQTVAPRIREKLTAGLGSVEVFEDTHSMIVTDFVDRLYAAWEVAQTAEIPTERDDDLTVLDYVALNTPSARLVSALERLRERDESWKITLNEISNVLLVSGRRDEVDRVLSRAKLLDARKPNPAFEESTHTIKLIYIKPSEAVSTLRDLFQAQVAAESVQIGGFDRDRKVVFRGSEYDAQRARAAIQAIDVKQENEKK